ncbi:YlzJ-like family protein [Sporomusa acidovorans]|uniref:YlzJ-like protein n=1 Tax=Sporomusa acidovorans (strain ATCC 49682 / DSM 3132 / Mol) TaxID=1123286 RepID=A0ABZ3J311_SPOA4|nr:YlzJ-like family protein [Sporomusa acidovorans]OZC20132.1 hypothetical protein SPACI_25300 [Sporomusa acidovorans DSM 3132]SDD44205.1 YlzJ-like protein [Sporomusa acidovorans]
MILWTIVPEDIIFAGKNQPVIPCEEIEYLGQKVLAEKISHNEFRVVRLLTTDPADYLRNELQPGQIITFKPVVEGLS